MTLRKRLFVVILLVVLLPLAIGGIAVLGVVPGAMRDQVETRLTTARASVVSALVDRCARAGLAAREVGLQAMSAGPAGAVQGVARRHADYAALLDENGRVVARAGRLPPSASDPTRLPSCSATAPTPQPDPPVLAESVRVQGQSGLARAVVAYRLDGPALRDLARALGVPGGLALVDGGRMVATTLPPPKARVVLAAVRESSGAPRVVTAGDLLVATSATRPGVGHTLVVVAPGPDTTWLKVGVGALVAGGLALAALLGAALARDLTRPLAELTAAADRVSNGDFDAEIPVRTRDETGRLASAFNEMTARIRGQVEALRQGRDALRRSRDALRHSLDRVGDALARSHDLDGILAVVLDTAVSAVDAESGAVYLATPEGSFRLRARTREDVDDTALTPGEGVLGQVVTQGDLVRGRSGDAPVLAAPIRRRGVVVGVLALYGSPHSEGFSEAHEQTVATLVTQGSVAVENMLLHEQAQRLAITDELTGLWNYRYLSMSLAREIDRAARFDRPLAVLMIDLDYFKQVNDTHGHERGNVVLVELARRVTPQIREVDTFARYGGEEFCLVLPETDADGAALVAERLCAVVRGAPFRRSGEVPLQLSVSVGVAVFPAHGGHPASLLRAADDALYAAKRAGRDTWVLASCPPREPRPDPADGNHITGVQLDGSQREGGPRTAQ